MLQTWYIIYLLNFKILLFLIKESEDNILIYWSYNKSHLKHAIGIFYKKEEITIFIFFKGIEVKTIFFKKKLKQKLIYLKTKNIVNPSNNTPLLLRIWILYYNYFTQLRTVDNLNIWFMVRQLKFMHC
jgi:hypothetical protein